MSTYKRRYYLHRQLKKYLKVDAQNKQVSEQIANIEKLPATYRKYVAELAGMGYNTILESILLFSVG